MFTEDQYQLLDFGEGRKLERVGVYVVDRPSPAADEFEVANPKLWELTDLTFERGSHHVGRWYAQHGKVVPKTWNVQHPDFRLELKTNEHGHFGVFPEHATNWEWISQQIRSYNESQFNTDQADSEKLKVLNLFAYTGASTLVAAKAGAEVTHIDSARNVVSWARRNAAISQLDRLPIRWIIEDAAKFVEREVTRGNSYDAVILDPPSYGHGPKGEVWKISDHLPALIENLVELTQGNPQFLVFTSHSNEFDSLHLKQICEAAWETCKAQPVNGFELGLCSTDNRQLHCGSCYRWSQF